MSSDRSDAKPSPASTHDNSDIAGLGYEEARDELSRIVSTLESGQAPLEESMRLWERGEALAQHCQAWLDGAQQRVDEALARRTEDDEDDEEKPLTPETEEEILRRHHDGSKPIPHEEFLQQMKELDQ